MPRSTVNANAMLDFEYGNVSYTPPATYYIALYSVAPNAGGGGTEFTGGGYARVAVANNLTNFPAASGGSKTIGTAITFPTLTVDHPDAVAFGIFDASSAGNFKGYGAISPSKQCLAGDVPFFAASTGLVLVNV